MNPPPVALVIGASSGIGALLSDSLESQGRVVVRVARWKGEPVPRDRPNAWHVRIDACNAEDVGSAVERIEHDIGPVALLICAAGDLHTGSAATASLSHIEALVDANVGPFVNSTVAVLPHMKRRRAGRLVAIGSGWTLLPSAGVAAYSAAKAALAAYVGCLDVEIRPYGVSAHILYPGYVRDTELAIRARALGLREPPRLLWTKPHQLLRLSTRIFNGSLPPSIFVNQVERVAPIASVVSQRMTRRAGQKLQPFPGYIDKEST